MNDELENPAAFPCPESERNYSNQEGKPCQTGMTLRDYFAAKVIQGFTSDHLTMLASKKNPVISFIDDLAGAAYELADAMLKARMK